VGAFDGVELERLQLRGPRLTLRPWQPADAPAVHAVMQHRSMYEFLALPDPYTPADAERFVAELTRGERARGTGFDSAIVETGSGRLVGSAALRRLDADPDVGYWIDPRARGRGFAAEATRLMADWAFEHGVPRVQLNCDVRNVGSTRVALAAGFSYEGTRRDYLLRAFDESAAPRISDLAWFSRLAGDPPGPVEPAIRPWRGAHDGVVRVRPLRPADATALYEQELDATTIASGFTGEPPQPERIRRLADRAGLDWLVGRVAALAVEDVGTGRYAGSLQLRLTGPPGVGGVGYALHPAFRGRGYTARALRLLSTWAFGPGGFVRLELGAKADNVASQRAALAAGFEPDGVRAARLRYPDGRYADEVRFALLAQSVSRMSP
jgi:RimJ/RimL family protein N-acetyltransferase